MQPGPMPLPNRKVLGSWPSSRLLELAEAHAGDRDLLEYIQTELRRRDAEVAHSAIRRISELLTRGNGAVHPDAEASKAETDVRIAGLLARIEALEQRVREADIRASAAERALAAEALPARGVGLLRRVHLADTAPIWLIEAARRAFRLRFHPDRFADPVMKARAEETFKDAEEVFRQITSGQ